MFSDESGFLLGQHCGWKRVCWSINETCNQACVVKAKNFGGGSVMVWAGNTETGRTEVVPLQGNLTAQHYIEEILEPHVVSFLRNEVDRFVIMEDNPPAHWAIITRQFLPEQKITVMNPSPAQSPNLNPIDHEMGCSSLSALYRSSSTTKSMHELESALLD